MARELMTRERAFDNIEGSTVSQPGPAGAGRADGVPGEQRGHHGRR